MKGHLKLQMVHLHLLEHLHLAHLPSRLINVQQLMKKDEGEIAYFHSDIKMQIQV